MSRNYANEKHRPLRKQKSVYLEWRNWVHPVPIVCTIVIIYCIYSLVR